MLLKCCTPLAFSNRRDIHRAASSKQRWLICDRHSTPAHTTAAHAYSGGVKCSATAIRSPKLERCVLWSCPVSCLPWDNLPHAIIGVPNTVLWGAIEMHHLSSAHRMCDSANTCLHAPFAEPLLSAATQSSSHRTIHALVSDAATGIVCQYQYLDPPTLPACVFTRIPVVSFPMLAIYNMQGQGEWRTALLRQRPVVVSVALSSGPGASLGLPAGSAPAGVLQVSRAIVA